MEYAKAVLKPDHTKNDSPPRRQDAKKSQCSFSKGGCFLGEYRAATDPRWTARVASLQVRIHIAPAKNIFGPIQFAFLGALGVLAVNLYFY